MTVCRVCLAMRVKMYHMSEHKLSVMYERVTGIEINTVDELPKMLCWECVARLSSANNFLEKAFKTQWILMNKRNSSRFLTLSEIESIDRTHYQLHSTLGFQVNGVNDSNLYKIMESNKINHYNIGNYYYYDKCEVESCAVVDIVISNEEEKNIITEISESEQVPIKSEYLEGAVEQNVADEDYNEVHTSDEEDIKFQDTNFIKRTHEIDNEEYLNDKELAIVDVKHDEDEVSEEDKVRDVYEGLKQVSKKNLDSVTALKNWSETLPCCKKPRMVLEDIMLALKKYNTHDSASQLTAQSSQGNGTVSYPPILNEILVKKNNVMGKTIANMDTIKAIYVNSKLQKINCPSNTINIASISTIAAGSNICVMQKNTESPSQVYICDICNKEFQLRCSFVRHIKIHSTPMLHSCKNCSYKTYYKSNLKNHINRVHTKTTVFPCNYCSCKFYLKSDLNLHINSRHTQSVSYICDYCSYVTYRKTNLSKHIYNFHTKPTVINCSYCNFKTCRKSILNKHTSICHKRNIIFNCSFCNYKISNKSDLRRHVNAKHTKTNVYNCSLCSYKAYDKCGLTIHVNTKHTKTNMYNCSLCSYKSYAKGALARHVNAKHTKTHVYNCSYCSYKAYDKNTLKKHVNAKHTKTNVYNCSHCNFIAYDKWNLGKHVNAKHTKTNIYNCSHCSHKASNKSSLNRHVNIKHTKTNVYNCSFCSYKAYDNGTLTRHVNAKHTKTKVYYCSLCSYKAYNKKTLSTHINGIHTKTNAYYCSSCTYQTYFKSNLFQHIKSFHSLTKDQV